MMCCALSRNQGGEGVGVESCTAWDLRCEEVLAAIIGLLVHSIPAACAPWFHSRFPLVSARSPIPHTAQRATVLIFRSTLCIRLVLYRLLPLPTAPVPPPSSFVASHIPCTFARSRASLSVKHCSRVRSVDIGTCPCTDSAIAPTVLRRCSKRCSC